MEDAFMHDCKTVCATLEVDPMEGLSIKEADRRRHEHGKNELPPPQPTPFLKLVLKQFEDLLVIILLFAALISFVLALFEEGEDRITAFLEPAVIGLILVANATVGVIQETNAERSIEALRTKEAREAQVLREGHHANVHASMLVPGDIVEIDTGDKVPADCRLLEIKTATLSVDEALLTGESVPASKYTRAIHRKDTVSADRRNMLFSGTLVVRGKARAVVTGTGLHTAMGSIAEALQEEGDARTPLKDKLDEFGELLSKVILWICVVVWLINIGHFTDPDHGGLIRGAIYYFKIAVALAVAAIPEGLPAVVTTCLALGTRKMAKKNAIVRTLPSVETLGCTTVICSDKTGTLTTNKMSVQRVMVVNWAEHGIVPLHFAVEGTNYAPYGRVTDTTNSRKPYLLECPAVQVNSLAEVSKIACLCNEAELSVEEDKLGKASYAKLGTPTEAALRVLAEKLGVPDEEYTRALFASRVPIARIKGSKNYWNKLFERQHLLEFSRDRKSMSVVMQSVQSKRNYLFVKGAPESVLSRSTSLHCSNTGKAVPMTKEARACLDAELRRFADQGLRILALAYQKDTDMSQDWTTLSNYANVESDLTFVGLVCVIDPPRPEVKQSIRKCQCAGIRVIVITGDNKLTAESICRRIGVFEPREDVTHKSFTGMEFEAMSEEQQEEAVKNACLFSRVEPKHKSRMVNLLRKLGEVAAMTGDGVNDAPALKSANIGVAMGSGTDVAREASDMVLQDDNFATIVMAVEEGRAIYQNTKQFIRYLISSNIGEVACIFLTALIGMPEALIPVQLLWVNLVTDGLPATALGFNPADSDIMKKPPRNPNEKIVNGWMFFRYMAIGIYVGIATVCGFIWYYLYYINGPQISFLQLRKFHLCGGETAEAIELFGTGFDCEIFHNDHLSIASTISLSILVTIEMFNALNALSENQSLLVVPPWSNMWVVWAMLLSFALHAVILYIPMFTKIFRVFPLGQNEWLAVFFLSFPVFLLDEVLKFITRNLQELQPTFRALPHRKTAVEMA